MNSAYDEAINLVPYINSKGQTVKNKNGDLQLIQQVNKKEKVEPYPEIIDLELYNGPNKQKFIKNKKFPMMTKGSITIDKKDNSGRITRKNIPLGKKAPLASKAAVSSKVPVASKVPPAKKAPVPAPASSKAPVPVVSKAPLPVVNRASVPVVSQGSAPISAVRSDVERKILQNENYESVLALNQATIELAEAIMSDQNASPEDKKAAQDAENLVNAALQSAEENALAEDESPIQRRNYSENKTELNNLINRLDSFITKESGVPLPAVPLPAVLSGADINGCPPIELLISWLKYLHSFNYEKKYIEKMNLINTDTFADDIIKPEIVKALEEIKNIPKKGMFQKSTYDKLLNLKAVEYIESQRVKYNDCKIKRNNEINEYDQTQFNKNIFEYFNSLLTRYNNNKFDIFEELKRIAADPTIDSTIQKFVKNKIDTKYFEFMVVFNDIDDAYWPEGGEIQKRIINKEIRNYLTKFSKIAKFKVGDRVEYFQEGYTPQDREPQDRYSPDFKYQGIITDVVWVTQSSRYNRYKYKIRITNNDGIDDSDLIKQNYQVGSVIDVYEDEEHLSLLPAMGGGGRRRKTKRNKKKTNKKKANNKKTKKTKRNKKKTNKKKANNKKTKKTKRNKKKTKRNYK